MGLWLLMFPLPVLRHDTGLADTTGCRQPATVLSADHRLNYYMGRGRVRTHAACHPS